MNLFCNPINLRLNPFVEGFNLESIKGYHSKTDLKNINPDLINLLESFDLEINTAPIFLTYPRQQTPIHLDGDGKINDHVKLNFIINEEDSYMVWYKPIADRTESSDTVLNTPYIYYNIGRVKEIHRQQLKGCALVQAAIPHNVVAFSKPRYCLSFPLHRKSNHACVTMKEGLEIFKDYIVMEESQRIEL